MVSHIHQLARPDRLAALVGGGLIAAVTCAWSAPPTYRVDQVLIPQYMLDVPFAVEAPTGFSTTPVAAPIYKPHEAVVDRTRNIWISANERGEHGNTNQYNPDATRVGEFRAGISIFEIGSNTVRARLIIDEPVFAPSALGFPANGILGPVAEPYASSTGWLYHGMDLLGTRGASTSSASGEETGEQECPTYPPGSASAFVQTVIMPVVLPPNSKWDPANFSKKSQVDKLGRLDPSGQVLRVAGRDPRYGNDILVGYDAKGRAAIMMPMGSECHARHPHGIAVDRPNGLVYLLIEHMGLEWNETRTDFDISPTTDREAGGGLVFDISNVSQPKIVTAYLAGHGAHEIEVSQQNGFVFMPNHEQSDSVTRQPNIFQSVVKPAGGNQLGVYGFIDTGYYQALQDLWIDDGPGADNTVYIVSHVGERMYAIDGNCTPKANARPTLRTDPYPPHTVYVEKAAGENCIKYWVDLRAPWNAYYGAVADQIFDTIDIGASSKCLRSVLHFHNLGFDAVNKKVYNGLHSIHHAEHTGLPWEEECPETVENPVTGEEPTPHYNGRSIVEVDVSPAHVTVNPVTKQATTPTAVIDMSHGYGYLQYPNVDDVVGYPTSLAESVAAMNRLMNSFVHPHWMTVDASRRALLVTGEHTGNLGVVNTMTRAVTQVLPVSIMNSGLRRSRSSDCNVGGDGVPDDLEPHMHGIQLDPDTGNLYLSDEGEHCFYEGTFIVTPAH
jgi:hypothetical protein